MRFAALTRESIGGQWSSNGDQWTAMEPTAFTGAISGIGGPVPKFPDLRPWTPRELAIAAFILEGTGGRYGATIH